MVLLPLQATAQKLALPELGDSSATSLSAEQEQQIGAEMVRRMRQAGVLIEEPLISDYINQLGRSLAVNAQSEQEFTFFVVNAPSINAFALPGGFIGVHSGLILATRTESELAGVVAHEIAHVTQHHLARGVEQANRMQLPLTVAIIAAIILGGGDSDVANAAIASGIGGSQQMQLNFTRAHEHEADRVGMQLLASSEYDPQGMAGFFSQLLDESRYYGKGVPEFLRTHPVTTTRLAEAQSGAEHYPAKLHVDSNRYLVARARLRLHHSKSAAELMSKLEEGQREEARHSNDIDSYLRAITHIALQQPEEGKGLLQKLLAKEPGSIAYRDTLGQLLYTQGEYRQALKLYRDGLKHYPYNPLLTHSLSRNLIALGHYPEAREQLLELSRRYPRSANSYRLLAQLEFEAGNKAASYLAQAEYYRLVSEPHSALEQLKLARRLPNLDFYLTSRIEALTHEIEESLKRGQKDEEK